MPAYLFQAPNGVPGDITRADVTNVEPATLKPVVGVYAQAFGIAMTYVSGGISQWQATNVAADFAGVLVREVPSIAGNSNQGFSDVIPNPVQVQGLAVRGYVSVLCKHGTPARGGIVYVRVATVGARLIGDFEADADGANSVALSTTQAEWASDGKDADNNAELRIAR